MYGGGCVLRLTPDGVIDREIAVPARCPTMVGFAGPDLDCLVVTTSSRNRSAEELTRYPLSGTVLVARRCGVRGMPEPVYVD
jgi:sugar lactone lactonase YvrE